MKPQLIIVIDYYPMRGDGLPESFPQMIFFDQLLFPTTDPALTIFGARQTVKYDGTGSKASGGLVTWEKLRGAFC